MKVFFIIQTDRVEFYSVQNVTMIVTFKTIHLLAEDKNERPLIISTLPI